MTLTVHRDDVLFEIEVELYGELNHIVLIAKLGAMNFRNWQVCSCGMLSIIMSCWLVSVEIWYNSVSWNLYVQFPIEPWKWDFNEMYMTETVTHLIYNYAQYVNPEF